MKEWARDNREGTDKRIIPAAIVLALLGIFASNPAFTNWVSGRINDLNSLISNIPQTILGISIPQITWALFSILWPVFVGLLSLIPISYFLLFRNLVVQSYIIEACTVAEYAARLAAKERQKLEAAQNKKRPWWINLLCKMMKRKRDNP